MISTLHNLLRPFAPRTRSTPAVRRFDAASGPSWGEQPRFGRVASETLAAVSTVRARARHAYANDPYCRAAVEAWVTILVGAGARPTSAHSDPSARAAISAAVEDWAADADMAGRTDYWGMQSDIARAMVLDGEAIVLMINTPEGLRLRQVPAELLDESETRDLGHGAYTVGGVEFDRYGRRVAYWIRPEIPSSVYAAWAPPERIDARDVLHIFKSMGAGQARGLSWLAPVLLTAKEVDKLQAALLTGSQVSAMLVGFIKNLDKSSADLVSAGQAYATGPVQDLLPGTVTNLGSDQEWQTTTPPPQSQHGLGFLSAQLRAIAVGVGVPAHLVSGDLSQANYGSLRADMIAFKQRAEQIQYVVLAPQLLRPIYARAVTSLVFSGEIDAPDFETAARDWTRAEHLFPAPPWIDPAKDAAAEVALVEAGFKSRSQVIAGLGWSPDAVDAEIAADRAREKKLGLSFGATAGTASEPAAEEPADNADA